MRTLIAVTNCHRAVYSDVLSRKEPPNNSLCVEAARQTWIKDAVRSGIDVKFFFGGDSPDGRKPEDDEVFLPGVPDDYDGLINKVTAMASWAYARGYNYFLKVDVDSYVHVQNFLHASDFFNWDYVGRGWGLGYLLSRKAMEIVMKSRQTMSWAEDSHVLRTLFKEANKGTKVSMYADGRFVFLPNLLDKDLPLYDTAFIVVNPMTPEYMHVLNEYQSLEALMPLCFAKEDLWTAGPDRVQHSIMHNAFVIMGAKTPYTYNEWVKMSQYDRTPAMDYSQIVFAALDADAISDCMTFEEWRGVVPERRKLLDICRSRNLESSRKLAELSKQFKKDQEIS